MLCVTNSLPRLQPAKARVKACILVFTHQSLQKLKSIFHGLQPSQVKSFYWLGKSKKQKAFIGFQSFGWKKQKAFIGCSQHKLEPGHTKLARAAASDLVFLDPNLPKAAGVRQSNSSLLLWLYTTGDKTASTATNSKCPAGFHFVACVPTLSPRKL